MIFFVTVLLSHSYNSQENYVFLDYENSSVQRDVRGNYIVVFDYEGLYERISDAETPDSGAVGRFSTYRENVREEFVREHKRKTNKVLEILNNDYAVRAQEGVGRNRDYVEYKNLISGIGIEINSEEQLEEIKELSFVEHVEREVMFSAAVSDTTRNLLNIGEIWQTQVQGTNLTGEGVKIAILDSGLDINHEDFGSCLNFTSCPKVLDHWDFVNNDSEPFDDGGHGTHVSSIAVSNNSDDRLKGVAPDAKLYVYKVLDSNGLGSTLDVYSAMDRALDPNEDSNFSDRADVISMSLGITESYLVENEIVVVVSNLFNVLLSSLIDAKVVVVSAAGNEGFSTREGRPTFVFGSMSFPGTLKDVIAVGSTFKGEENYVFCSTDQCYIQEGEVDDVAFTDSKGPTYFGFVKPDLTAPGVNICAARAQFQYTGRPQCLGSLEHVSISGTSMATPIVSGVVALIKQAKPNWTPQEIKAAVMRTAKPLDEGYLVGGRGRIQPLKALSLENPPCLVSISIENHTASKDGYRSTAYVSGNMSCPNFLKYEIQLGRSYRLSQNPDVWHIVKTGTDENFTNVEIDLSKVGRFSLMRLVAYDENSSYMNYDMLFMIVEEYRNEFSDEINVSPIGNRDLLKSGEDTIANIVSNVSFSVENSGEDGLFNKTMTLTNYILVDEINISPTETLNLSDLSISLERFGGEYLNFLINQSNLSKSFYSKSGRVLYFNSTHHIHIFDDNTWDLNVSFRLLKVVDVVNLTRNFSAGVNPVYLNFTFLEEGLNYLYVSFLDFDKFTNPLKIQSLVVVPPIFIISPLGDRQYNSFQDELIYLVLGDALINCWYSTDLGVINSTPQNCSQGNFSGVESFEGRNNWIVYANDSKGNIVSSDVNFIINLMPPSINIIEPSNSTMFVDNLSFGFVANFSENISQVLYNIQGVDTNITDELIDNRLLNTTFRLHNYGLNSYNVSFKDSYGLENFTIFDVTANRILYYGNLSSVDSNVVNLSLEVNNSNVIFLKNSRKIVEFIHNFSLSKINLTEITILEKKDNNLSKILVGGINLSLGQKKTIFLDISGNRTKFGSLCIKDLEVSNFSQMSLNCSLSDEVYIHKIPSNEGNVSVSFTNSSNTNIRVSGLSNSLVSQMCSENWKYSNFSECQDGRQVAGFSVDLNSCGTELTKNATRLCRETQSQEKKSSEGGGSRGIGRPIGEGLQPIIKTNLFVMPNYKVQNEFDVLLNGVEQNLSESLSGIRNVTIGDRLGVRVVEFTHNFEKAPLNLSNLEIERETLNKSYVIVRGLSDIVTNKSFRVLSVRNSGEVCIKDSEVNNISEITSMCSNSSETLLKCDGRKIRSYTCSVDGNYYLVLGLRHSAVVEFDLGLTEDYKEVENSSADIKFESKSDREIEKKILEKVEENSKESDRGQGSHIFLLSIFALFVVLIWITVKNTN